MNKKKLIITMLISIMIIASLISIYAGRFPFKKPDTEVINSANTDNLSEKPADIPSNSLKYRHLSRVVGGNKQEINLLEIDLGKGDLEIRPVLSYDNVFGYEKLSSIFARTGAYAAVNAGFFYEYGMPAGMVAVNGKLVTKSTGKYPVFIVDGNKAEIKEVKTKLWLTAGDKKIEINNINAQGKPGEVVLYTPLYGTDNRAKMGNITVSIKNDIVEKIMEYRDKAPIPKDSDILTFYKKSGAKANNLPFNEGERLIIYSEPEMKPGFNAYECGSWIVRDGKIAVPEKDEWVGVLTNRDPRTVVGIKEDGTVIFITVDGRQPGYSIGLTGRELGGYLIECGIKNAAMLDGGASTEMIVEGKIVNTPSYKGQERPVGGGIIIKYK